MSARVLVAYAECTGFTSRQAADVAGEIAGVSGLDVDVQPIAYVATIAPYVAVFLGWSGHSRAGRRETSRFLERNAALLGTRRIWVVHRQPGGDGVRGSGRGPVRLSRLLVRHGVVPVPYAARSADDTWPIPVIADSERAPVAAAKPA